jgi:TolB-like protein/Flp pilus assembly protein TadD
MPSARSTGANWTTTQQSDPVVETGSLSSQQSLEQQLPAPATQPGTPALSIAVLPFVNMSSDPEQEYFSDGLTEELLNLLAKIPELKVAARTSSFYYKDRMHDIPFREIGRQLEVAHLLEGSVRKGGGQVRITAQLIKADDGYHLWSETWDRTLDDVFAIQDEIAAAVTEQLKITLLGESPHARVIDTKSWDLTLEGRFYFTRRNEGDEQKAFELFSRAVELDPDNATAWVGLAPLYLWLNDPPDTVRSRHAVERALELEPNNPEAYIRLARVNSWEGNSEEGFQYYIRALELGPHNPLVLAVWSGIMERFGELEAGVEFQERAVRADPLYVHNLNNLAMSYALSERLEEADAVVVRALEIAPNNPMLSTTQAEVRLLQGRPQEALDLLETVSSTDAGIAVRHDFLRVLALLKLEQLDQARLLAAQLSANPDFDDIGKVMLQAAIGEVEAALDKLQHLKAGTWAANWVQTVYAEPLRGDPRWDAFVARLPRRGFDIPGYPAPESTTASP